MQITKKKIDELKPANYNPRKNLKPGDKKYEKLKKSIKEFGYDTHIKVGQKVFCRLLKHKLFSQ